MVGRGFVGDAAVSGGGVHVLVLAGDGPRFLPCRKFAGLAFVFCIWTSCQAWACISNSLSHCVAPSF